MDLLLACEGLIPNITDDSSDVLESDVKRWQHLFGFSRAEAVQEIQDWRSNLGRQTITAHAWSMINDDLEAPGYDKEAYEYAISTRFQDATYRQRALPPHQTPRTDSSSYLFRLEGPIPDVETLKEFAVLPSLPAILQGTDDDGWRHSSA
jgi:hypothetical protein